MKVNLPTKIRKALYIVTAISTPVVYYLSQQGVVNDFWSGLYVVVVTAVSGLAALNTKEG
jgi:hypothetical protein